MRSLIILLLVVLGSVVYIQVFQSDFGQTVNQGREYDSANTDTAMGENISTTATTQEDEEEPIKEIHIRLGNFFFEGPDGRSGSENKTPTEIEPQVIARLVNKETVKLVFENTSSIVDHEVISPLFSAPEEVRHPVPPNGKLEIIITPDFLTVEDGGTLTFHIVCHVRHGQTTDHYKLGMHGLIEIVPGEN